MKKLIKVFVLVLLAVSLTTYAAGDSMTESTTENTGYFKQAMLVPDATEGKYIMYVYANNQINSPYETNGNQWVLLTNYLEVTPLIDDYAFSMTTTEYIVNYFLDDYYFIFERVNSFVEEPYYLIEKATNKIVANPDIWADGDLIKASDLEERFGIKLQEIYTGRNAREHVLLLTLEKKYEFKSKLNP